MARQQRLSTIMDRGFAALDDGDYDAAEAALMQAQRIDRQHPDVLVLDGELNLIAEEFGTAEESFRKAMAAAPDALPPRLGLGRTLLSQLFEAQDAGDERAAREAADEILQVLAVVPRDSEDHPESLLTRLAALAGVGGKHEAGPQLLVIADETIEVLPELALDAASPVAVFDLPRVLGWLERAAAQQELRADALHMRGMVLADNDQREQMIAAWSEVWRLDGADDAPPPEVTATDEEFEEMAQAALQELPPELRERLRRAAILVDDRPPLEMVAEGVDPRSLGLFTGTPTTEEQGGQPALTHIYLFKQNLERMCRDLDELAEQVQITVWHETAHFFGLDEDGVSDLGLA
ncbi:MAG: metallopeptidase family protein [Myxococcales bacterium]|nr:metallopeptidase family protein [Myxococcales bacterium]